MKDRFGNEVGIVAAPNGHVLVLGQAGQGKTFSLCRQIEKYVEQKKRVYIIDYSGSFTEEELFEKNFKYIQQLRRINLAQEKFCWNLRIKNEKYYQKDVTDALLEVLKCKSYFQTKLLELAIQELIEAGDEISFANIINQVESQLYKEKTDESVVGNKDNLGRLLTRLVPYESIEGFSIKYQKVGEQLEEELLTIIDLTELPEKQRKLMTELISSLLWKEVYRKEMNNRCDVLVLDEFQFLSVKDGSTLATMLREGRKKKLSVVLSTQFISHYNKAEVRALEQAANIFIFHPAEADMKFAAKLIDLQCWREWERILQSLRMGEAVVKGCFQTKQGSIPFFDTLIVKI